MALLWYLNNCKIIGSIMAGSRSKAPFLCDSGAPVTSHPGWPSEIHGQGKVNAIDVPEWNHSLSTVPAILRYTSACQGTTPTRGGNLFGAIVRFWHWIELVMYACAFMYSGIYIMGMCLFYRCVCRCRYVCVGVCLCVNIKLCPALFIAVPDMLQGYIYG